MRISIVAAAGTTRHIKAGYIRADFPDAVPEIPSSGPGAGHVFPVLVTREFAAKSLIQCEDLAALSPNSD